MWSSTIQGDAFFPKHINCTIQICELFSQIRIALTQTTVAWKYAVASRNSEALPYYSQSFKYEWRRIVRLSIALQMDY